MSGGVTVIGLTQGSFLIEDIRVYVPYQTAVQIPAHLAQRSRHLGEALQQQRLMQLGNAWPPPIIPKEPVLTPMLRGRGIAPHNPFGPLTPTGVKQGEPAPWQREREALLRELELSQAQCQQLQGFNETLQGTLTNMSAQLAHIQRTLDVLTVTPAGFVHGTAVASVPKPEAFLDEAAPHFIPSTTQEAAEVRIVISEGTSTSDLTDVRGALRSLRGKPPP